MIQNFHFPSRNKRVKMKILSQCNEYPNRLCCKKYLQFNFYNSTPLTASQFAIYNKNIYFCYIVFIIMNLVLKRHLSTDHLGSINYVCKKTPTSFRQRSDKLLYLQRISVIPTKILLVFISFFAPALMDESK